MILLAFSFKKSNMSLEKILAIGKDWFNPKKVSTEDKKMLTDLFYKHTKTRLGACVTCYGKMYNYFKNQNQNNMKATIKSNCNFTLKETSVLYTGHRHVTNTGLTDEIAIDLLKRDPGKQIFFTKLPVNWKELCGLVEVKKPKEIEEEKVDLKTEENFKLKENLFKGKNLLELQEVASNMELPEEEWIKLGEKKLKEYIIKNS